MSDSNNQSTDLGLPLGALAIRIWLGVRALQTGIEKFAGSQSGSSVVAIDGQPNDYGLTEATAEKAYAFSNYHGVPAALRDKFEGEPLIPGFFLNIYDIVLGPLLLILGLTVLLGLAKRISLFAMGLVYTSLTFGLILIKQDAGVAWLGVHMILIGMALALAQHDRFALMKRW